MGKLAAVLFDLGDTLVDLGEGRGDYEARLMARAARVCAALAALGASIADPAGFAAALAHESETRYRAAVAQQRGLDIYDVMRTFLPQMGLPADENHVRTAGDAFYEPAADSAGLRTGAIELLSALRAHGYRLGVISNTLQPGPLMDRTLARRGLLEFFPVRIYSSEVRVAKPHPAIFRAGLAALGLPAERVVYVGDRLYADVAGAQGVGMWAVLIEVAHRQEDDPAILPHARIRELPEFPAVLRRLEAI